jgi:LysM repeat protein
VREVSAAGTAGPPDAAVPRAPSNRPVTPAVAVALIILAVSFALSVAFVLANGGLDLPAAADGSGSSSHPATAAPTPTGRAKVTPSAASTSGSSGSVSRRSASTTQPAAPAPMAARPGPTPVPGLRRPPNRYAHLTTCPGTHDCWIYIVRRADNLFSIAGYFGVSLSVVRARNPWTRTTRLPAGQKLLLPTPER